MKKIKIHHNSSLLKKILIAALLVISAIAVLGIILAIPTIRANSLLDDIAEYTASNDTVTRILITDLNSMSEQSGNGGRETLVTDKAKVSALISRLNGTVKNLKADTVVASSLGAWGIRLRAYSDETSIFQLILTEDSVIMVDGDRMYSYVLSSSFATDDYTKLYKDVSDMLK
ncbi:MAG: hypothetical protein IKA82_01560 [Clostridia bacterium]|nr:hypothetical protein [Clostridia bacterium]